MKDDIHQLNEVFKRASHDLGVTLLPGEIARLSTFIYQAMTGEGRYFHTTAHALNLCDLHDPIQSMAALFHDVVYFQVDRGFSDQVWETLKDYLLPRGKGNPVYTITGSVPGDDRGFHMVRELFGWPAGQDVALNSGTNELLSCLVMLRQLSANLTAPILLKISAYIETTIPFRPRDEKGIGPFERLQSRFIKVSHDFNLPMAEAEIEETMHGAVRFANRDVENFAGSDPAGFLETTWKLLPEAYPAIRIGCDYTYGEYRQALQGMVKFLHSIQAEHVYHDYAGIPDQQTMGMKLEQVRSNLQTSSRYIEVKLLTMAILETLAEISGGDAPVALFLGDIHNESHTQQDISNQLPRDGREMVHRDVNPSIAQLLHSGRRGLVDFTDLKTSPVALFIYERSGEKLLSQYLQQAYLMFDNRLSAEEFLLGLEPALLTNIVEACGKMASQRAGQLKSFARVIA
ncbi:MAG: hypothetical protein C3F13_09395 [Anaerolineales bacterium]|nr:MAG: hypothetical protein C3F13_09395 [Anaerolineales bacterium]